MLESTVSATVATTDTGKRLETVRSNNTNGNNNNNNKKTNFHAKTTYYRSPTTLNSRFINNTPILNYNNGVDPLESARKHNSYSSFTKNNYELNSVEMSKPIFISYDPSCNFQEKKFILDLVRQLKENSLYDDIWFDKDEMLVGKPMWSLSRLEAAEFSTAAVLIVTPNYFEDQLTIYESKAIYDLKTSANIFYLAIIVLYVKGYSRVNTINSASLSEFERNRAKKIAQNFGILQPLIQKADLFINLTEANFMSMSLSERISHCVGLLTPNLDKYAHFKRTAPPMTPFDVSDSTSIERREKRNTPSPTPVEQPTEQPLQSTSKVSKYSHKRREVSTGKPRSDRDYSGKSFIFFKPNDVQMWLEDMCVDEFHRLLFAELQVDGWLLHACNEQDLIYIFEMDNKLLRKKLLNTISETIKKELQLPLSNWHLHLKYIKPGKANSVYVIFDTLDSNAILPFLNELVANNIDVVFHPHFVTSKDDFMKINGTSMAQCKYILVYLTENAAQSSMVFVEAAFSQLVLNKPKLITIMVKNVWKQMRHSLKAILGDNLALDFTSNNLSYNLKPLLQFFKPHTNPYENLIVLDKNGSDDNSFKSLDLLANTTENASMHGDKLKVYVSQVTDHWDIQKRLEQLLASLETLNIKCLFDLFTIESQRVKYPINKVINTFDDFKTVQQNIRSAQILLCCITPKYLASDTSVKDLNLADSLRIPIVPLIMKQCQWPPENVQFQIRRALSSLKSIDLSSDSLFKKNLPNVISAINQAANKSTNKVASARGSVDVLPQDIIYRNPSQIVNNQK